MNKKADIETILISILVCRDARGGEKIIRPFMKGFAKTAVDAKLRRKQGGIEREGAAVRRSAKVVI